MNLYKADGHSAAPEASTPTPDPVPQAAAPDSPRMVYCTNCGLQIPETAKICPQCGVSTAEDDLAAISAAPKPAVRKDTAGKKKRAAAPSVPMDEADITRNKGMAVLSYLSFLVLIPVFTVKDSAFVKFHANQGLPLLIAGIVWWIISKLLSAMLGSLSLLGLLLPLLSFAVYAALAVLSILGIIQVLQGKAKELPLLGKIHILK